MTKKDYIQLAKLIRGNTLTDTNGVTFISTVEEFIEDLCYMLKKDNSHFDRERFITACKGGRCCDFTEYENLE
jgi:hypothetical protein